MTKFETLPPAPEVISELARVRADLYVASVFRTRDGSVATAADFSGAHAAMRDHYVAEMRASK